MAELGSMAGLLGGEDGKKEVEIRADMLDYAYIEECADIGVLKGILEKLQANDYGYYPEVSVCIGICVCACVLSLLSE